MIRSAVHIFREFEPWSREFETLVESGRFIVSTGSRPIHPPYSFQWDQRPNSVVKPGGHPEHSPGAQAHSHGLYSRHNQRKIHIFLPSKI